MEIVFETTACELVQWYRHGAVHYVRLNRPSKANAYTQPLLRELDAQVAAAAADEAVKAIVVCAAGNGAFCAGADFDELKQRNWQGALELESAAVFGRIAQAPCVTLAAIGGAACGGGLELALACDVRIAADTARFAFPEPQLGLIPAAGGTQRLRQVVGQGRAKELILAGQVWDAQAALQAGLVSEVTPRERLLECAQAWAERIAGRDRTALRLAKMAIDVDQASGAGLRFEALAQAVLYEIRHGAKRAETDTKD